MKTDIEKRTCPYSGEEFIPKRPNQVFVNSKNRIAYHNERHNAIRRELSKLNKPLKKSYEVLAKLLEGKEVVIVHKERLRGLGFSFSVFTHLHQNKSSKEPCNALYCFHYYKVDDNHYKILRND